MTKSITIIVPRLPPAVDGLGDYGFALASQLRNDFGIDAHFIVGDPAWNGPASIDNFKIEKIKTRTESALFDLLTESSDTVFLHYVGYGYAKRGCPLWLMNGLRRWKVAHHKRRLVSMFHEIYATGPIWTSQFWTSKLQKSIATQLISLSNECVTSKKIYADLISQLSNEMHSPSFLPVFSNVGEPKFTRPLSERPNHLIIFGGTFSRTRIYENSLLELEKICIKFQITQIFDIGPALEISVEQIGGISIQPLGPLSREEVSNRLLNAKVGVLNYSTEYLAKSGIFAAYCSHHILPIVIWNEEKKSDEIEAGREYLFAKSLEMNLTPELEQKIADNAHAWYQGHNLSVHAKLFSDIL